MSEFLVPVTPAFFAFLQSDGDIYNFLLDSVEFDTTPHGFRSMRYLNQFLVASKFPITGDLPYEDKNEVKKREKLHTTTVYLAGKISNSDPYSSLVWRWALEETLAEKGLIALNPLRGKGSFFHHNYVAQNTSEQNKIQTTDWFRPEEILSRDLEDIYLSDVVVANLSHLKDDLMIGTLMELGYAMALGRKVIVYIDPEVGYEVTGVMENHPFLCHFPVYYYFEEVNSAIESL